MKNRFTEVIKIIDGRVCNIAYHKERINRTLLHFYEGGSKSLGCGRNAVDNSFDNSFVGGGIRGNIINELSNAISNFSAEKKAGLYKLRLVYSDRVESIEINPYQIKKISSLAIVNQDSISYSFKYEDRQILNELRANSACDEIMIVKNGMITDSSVHNLVFKSDKGLFTPDTFLLNGTKRQYLLAQGVISEKQISVSDIKNYTSIHFINAMIDLEDDVSIVYPEIEVWNGELKQDSVCFVADAIIGNVTKPYDFKTTDTREYNYALNKDWNWISIPIDLGNKNSVATVFAALDKDIEEVKSITHFMRQDSIAWIGNLDAQGGLENSKMYKLKLKNKALFNIEGKPIDLASEPIKIEMNWNWLPYLPIDNLSISEAFSSFEPTEGDVIKSQTAFATYTKEQSWVGSLNRLEPGKGYMYRALKPKELTYPSIVGNMTYNLKNAEGVKGGGTTKATDLHWVVDIHKYPNNMNIIAALQKDSTDITSENIQIGAFVNEECRGAAIASFVPEIGKYRVFLTVYGQKENEVLTFKVFDGQEHNSATKLSYVNDGILGSLESPFYVNMQTTNIEQEQSNSASVELYPNPVSTTVFVKSTEPILKMEIFSIDGRKMYSENLSTSETKVKVEHLMSGLYIVKLYFTDGVVTKRFVK